MKRGAVIVHIIAACLCAASVHAQDIPGYNTSNYTGISGTDLQPACIADMRYRVDITLAGAGIDFNNNYISVYTRYIQDNSIAKEYDGNFQKHFLNENLSPAAKSVALNTWVQLPSFAVSITPLISAGFTARLRNMMNLDEMTPELAHLAYTGLSMTDPLNQQYFRLRYNSNSLNISQMSWWEYGIDYAQVLHDQGYHFLKAGIRLKIAAGLEAQYVYGNPLSYSWKNNDTLSLYNSDFRYGHTQNIEKYMNGGANAAKILTGIQGVSPSADIGLVYEWRPEHYSYGHRYKMPPAMQKRHLNKYKLRLGISVLDLGSLSFNSGQKASIFTANKTDWNVHNIHIKGNAVHAIDTLLYNNFGQTSGDTRFSFYLPTALSLQADYQLYKDFYLNFTSYTPLYSPSAATQVHALAFYTVTPRWDSRWFGVFVPLGVNGYGQFTSGLTLRLGPVIVGTANGLNLLFTNQLYGINIYAALKVPILYADPNHKTRSNRGDRCPTF